MSARNNSQYGGDDVRDVRLYATSNSLVASFDGVIPVDDFHSFTSILGGDNYSYNGSFWAERQSAPFAISSDGQQISVAFDGSQLVVN